MKPQTSPTAVTVPDQKPRVTRRRFDPAWKRAIVERALRPGASVAKIARDHDLNANQLFKWCRQHERAAAGEPISAMLPVVIDESKTAPAPSEAPSATRLTVELARGSLKVDGPLDLELL